MKVKPFIVTLKTATETITGLKNGNVVLFMFHGDGDGDGDSDGNGNVTKTIGVR